MPSNVRTPSGHIVRVNATDREGAIREIFASGRAAELGFVRDNVPVSPQLEGPLDAFRVGSGRTVNKGFNMITRNLDREREQAAQFEQSAGQFPIARGAGELAPALATMLISGGVGTAAATGGALGALSTPEAPLAGAAGGAAFGAGGFMAGQFINSLPGVSRFGAEVSEQIQRSMSRLRKLRIPLRPSQVNPGTARAEALLESNLGSRGVFGNIDDVQQKTLNRLAAQSIGQDTDDVSLSVLERARREIGNRFRQAVDSGEVPLDETFRANVAAQADNIISTPGVSPDAANVVKNALNQLDDAGPAIPAERYQAWQSNWRKLATSAWKKGDAQLGEFYSTLAESLDDAAARVLPSDKLATLQEARRLWGNLKALTRLDSSVNKQTGNVNARTFSREVRRTAGNEDLAALTDVVALPRFQNPGTADRLLSNQLLPGGLGATVGAVASDDPLEGAAIGAGAGFAGSRVAAELFTRGGLLPEFFIPGLTSRLGALFGADVGAGQLSTAEQRQR